MDQPAPNSIRVGHEQLKSFVYEGARKVEMPQEQAALLAELLIANDLRGVLSHGSRQIARYVREIRAGGVNPRPHVRMVRETQNSLVMDGDFGLGYFPAHEGTLKTIEKAKQHGMAALVTRNHGHIGAAGTYARMTLGHDLLTFVTSGVQLELSPGDLVVKAAGASPIAMSAPALHEPPLVLDCGVTHDIQGDPPHRDQIVRVAPAMVLRALGFGAICQAWGGLLSGLSVKPNRAQRKHPAANQGAMLFTLKIALFADVEEFKLQMDEYARQTRRLEPLQGTRGAYLPGGIEAEQEQAYRGDGVPLSEGHQRDLEEVAEELSLRVPWR